MLYYNDRKEASSLEITDQSPTQNTVEAPILKTDLKGMLL